MTMPVPPLPDIWQGRQFFCPYPVNVVKYDTTDVDENQRVDYRVAKQEESKIKNQILCNK